MLARGSGTIGAHSGRAELARFDRLSRIFPAKAPPRSGPLTRERLYAFRC